MAYKPKPKPGGRKVFVASFIHAKTGQRVYPKTAKAFCFYVK